MSARVASETWITGLGVACPAGVGVEAFWSALLAPAPERALVTPKARAGVQVPPAVVFAKDFPAEDYVDRRLVRKASNLSRLALSAAHMAWSDAGAIPEEGRDDFAAVVGTTLGSSDYYLRFYETLLERGPKGANAVLFTEGVFNAPSGHISKAFGLRGYGHTLVGGEEVGLSGPLLARDRIALGRSQAALAGGADAYSDLSLASLWREGRVSDAHQPRGMNRRVSPFCEGAALALLESAESARARDARPYAVFVEGARRRGAGVAGFHAATEAVLSAAGLEAEAIDLIVSDSTNGPRARDHLYLEGVLTRPSQRFCAPMVGLGEGFAFGSAATLAAAALALRHGIVPPTFGVDPAAPGDLASAHAVTAPTEAPLRHALVVSTTSPGSVTVALLKRA